MILLFDKETSLYLTSLKLSILDQTSFANYKEKEK